MTQDYLIGWRDIVSNRDNSNVLDLQKNQTLFTCKTTDYHSSCHCLLYWSHSNSLSDLQL